MSLIGRYYTDQEKPGLAIEYKDGSTIVDLSSGYTFTAELVRGTTIVASQTTNMTGAATSPNFTMSEWTAAVLTAIAADLVTLGVDSYNYEYRPYARANSKDEVLTSQADPKFVQFIKAAA